MLKRKATAVAKTKTVKKIDIALRPFDEGDYGECFECEGPSLSRKPAANGAEDSGCCRSDRLERHHQESFAYVIEQSLAHQQRTAETTEETK